MAGRFPADMPVKKNIYMEEWNGMREITEKIFEVNFENAPVSILYAILFPYAVYTLTRDEFLARAESEDDPRFKHVI